MSAFSSLRTRAFRPVRGSFINSASSIDIDIVRMECRDFFPARASTRDVTQPRAMRIAPTSSRPSSASKSARVEREKIHRIVSSATARRTRGGVVGVTARALTRRASILLLTSLAGSAHASTYGARGASWIAAMGAGSNGNDMYPGTATSRMLEGRARAASLSEDELSKDWESVRGKLLWAAGLKDLRDVPPGRGNTAHCFNDFNHVDATTMRMEDADNENGGRVAGMAYANPLGAGIRVARDETMGEGGSWCTCILGSNAEPPKDVAHVQFQSRVAWKLVWVPGPERDFKRFVLVDDEGEFLATGRPSGSVPAVYERERNYETVRGGRYARVADSYA